MENTFLANYKLISFDKIPSTQTYAYELIASDYAVDKTVVVADFQSSGYGRHKRKWVSNKGNLYSSFIYQVKEKDPRLSYAIAIAVAETLISFGIEPNIKWPNDILICGKKVCGILIEYHKDFVIVGIGINIKSNPKNLQYETTRIIDYVDINRTKLLSALIENLEVWRVKDFSFVRQRWMDLAIGLNNIVEYNGTKVTLVGIAQDGALVLRSGGKDIIKYGDEINI